MTTQTALRISLLCTTVFIVLLILLHGIKPELDPSWRFISEYAIGDHGWLMVLAFFLFAANYLVLVMAFRTQLNGIVGRLGLASLLISASGLILAGLFTTDPVTAAPDQRTQDGELHALGGALGMAMPFAALFTCLKLIRLPPWTPYRRSLIATTVLALLGTVYAVISLGSALSASGGTFGPDVHVGWPTRIELAIYCLWSLVVAGLSLKAIGTVPKETAHFHH